MSENNIAEGYIKANGINLYYLEQGKGYPIILLHGGLGTAKTAWENLIPILSTTFHVIAPDCRGHGRSDNPTNEFSYKLMADDIIGLIDALNLNNPMICGHSDGGQIALELAINHADRIKAIVVSGVLIEISVDYIKELNTWGFEKPGVINFQQLEIAWKDFLPALQEEFSYVYGPDYWKIFIKEISKVWLNPIEFPGDSVSNIEIPVLILHGDRDITPIEDSLRIFKIIPNSEFAVAPNSNHSFPTRNYKLYFNLITDFLQRNSI